jgi:hypothetical protein
MASYKVLYPDNTLADVQGELNDLRNQDAIVGYRVLIAWSALEDDEGLWQAQAHGRGGVTGGISFV